MIFVSARLVSSISGACMNTTKRQPKSQRQPPRGRLSVALAALLFALLFSPLAKAEPMKIDDITVGSVISEQIELPQFFGSDWFPLPPGNWVVEAVDLATNPGGVRTGFMRLTLSNQDVGAKVPLLVIGLSKKPGHWDPPPCQGLDPSKRIYFSGVGNMPTSPNESKCAYIADWGQITESRANTVLKANTPIPLTLSLWNVVIQRPELVQRKFIQRLTFGAQPWGAHANWIEMLLESKKEDIAPNGVVLPQLLDWIHLNADLLTQAAAGKKVALTAFPAF